MEGAPGRPGQIFCPLCLLAGLVWAPFQSVFSGCDSDPFFSPSRAAGLELRAGACAMAPHWAVWLLVVELWGLGLGAEVWWNLVPRKTVSSGGECLKAGEQAARRDCWGKRGAKELPSGTSGFILQLGARP